jgi:hypothetical protein
MAGRLFIKLLPLKSILKEDIESENARNHRGPRFHAQTFVCENR